MPKQQQDDKRSSSHASVTFQAVAMQPAEPLAGRPRHDSHAFETRREAKCMYRRKGHEREREGEREEREREPQNATCLEHAHAETHVTPRRRQEGASRCPCDAKAAKQCVFGSMVPCPDTAPTEARSPCQREKMPGQPVENTPVLGIFLKMRLACTPRALSRLCVRARVRFVWEKWEKQDPGHVWSISGNKFFSRNKAWARPPSLAFSSKTQEFLHGWPEFGPKTHGRGIEGCPF